MDKLSYSFTHDVDHKIQLKGSFFLTHYLHSTTAATTHCAVTLTVRTYIMFTILVYFKLVDLSFEVQYPYVLIGTNIQEDSIPTESIGRLISV